jgi:hypothetical protein
MIVVLLLTRSLARVSVSIVSEHTAYLWNAQIVVYEPVTDSLILAP